MTGCLDCRAKKLVESGDRRTSSDDSTRIAPLTSLFANLRPTTLALKSSWSLLYVGLGFNEVESVPGGTLSWKFCIWRLIVLESEGLCLPPLFGLAKQQEENKNSLRHSLIEQLGSQPLLIN